MMLMLSINGVTRNVFLDHDPKKPRAILATEPGWYTVEARTDQTVMLCAWGPMLVEKNQYLHIPPIELVTISEDGQRE